MSDDVKVEVRLEPHQERVVEEKRELDEKIEKLTDFLRTPQAVDVPSAEVERLLSQLGIMHLYSRVLRDRIRHF
jgi:hypothetical protein